MEIDIVRGRPLPFNPEDVNVKKVVGNSNTRQLEALPVNGDNTLRRSNQSLISDSSSQLGSQQQQHGYHAPRAMEQRRFDRQDSVGRASIVSAPALSPGRYVRLSVVRGPKGFGFTIADSQYGQRIKEIFDKERCRGLQEGDLIVEINSRVVRNLEHGEVVNELKACAQNTAAEFVLQRGGKTVITRNLASKFSSDLALFFLFLTDFKKGMVFSEECP